ncbi:hypothetical protein KUL156_10820 [Alteromonas sp. KUL156]|nr:hypothetical protein KUL154_42980 [Alteromonas sp. KUL154]GFD98489.1 hypothetical protein KUL156_10820 [Alteromonas sp. KUL156]
MSMALFRHPLHGVVCRPWSTAKSQAYELHLRNKAISPKGDLLWQGNQSGKRFNTGVTLLKDKDSYFLKVNCQGKGAFRLANNNFDIDWLPQGTPASHYFQSMGLALWLELQGVLCLHGNALNKGDKTIVLIAPSGTGKSTLSAALMKNGYKLLTDDMVALHKTQCGTGYGIYPSWPLMRLWPDSIEYVAEAGSDLSRVHKRFDKKIVPINSGECEEKTLTEIILLNRQDSLNSENNTNKEIQLLPLSGVSALMPVLTNTILGEVYRPLGIESERLSAIAELTKRVRISKLTYPSGVQGLRAVTNWLA